VYGYLDAVDYMLVFCAGLLGCASFSGRSDHHVERISFRWLRDGDQERLDQFIGASLLDLELKGQDLGTCGVILEETHYAMRRIAACADVDGAGQNAPAKIECGTFHRFRTEFGSVYLIVERG